MIHFIQYRSVPATALSVASPVFAPALGRPHLAPSRFRAVSKNNIKTQYNEQSKSSISR